MTTTTILNVDDNDAARYARSRLLRQAGFEVIEASTGAEGLRILAEVAPQLVLMDVRLPDMNGLDVTRRIKSDPASMRTPVVQVSATFVTEQDRIIGLEGGADIYLTEPVEPQELLAAVRTLLRLRTVEKGLVESEARWRRLFSANVIGVIVATGTRVQEANDEFLRMIGLPRAQFDLLFLDLARITPEKFQPLDGQALAELRATGTCSTFEKELLRPDGGSVRVLMGGASLNGGGDRWLGFVLDISERRRVEAEREELLRREQAARSEAERATRIKDEFLANLSHELRTPMSTITSWLHLLRGGRLDEKERQRALDAIERATSSQNQLIEDLLDISRITAGKLVLKRESVDLRTLIQSALDYVALTAEAKGVDVHIYLPEECIGVAGDSRRLQQVFWNLLNNAVKFTPSGGRVDVECACDDLTLTVKVRDTGEGIAPEFLPQVFERFTQANGSISRKHGGMGLGLAIVRHVVELHGGSVRAESEGEGRGATFIVELPRATAADAPLVQGKEPPQLGNRPLAGIQVLLVEDDADAREVAKTLLVEAGAGCRVASSAREALTILDDWQPSILISDIGMSEIDGYELMARLRARSAVRGGSLPAVALTAFARHEDCARVLASGYDAHVVKPVDPDHLAAIILRLVH